MLTDPPPCPQCKFPVPFDREQCPHCAHAPLFPNVRRVATSVEKEALQQRFELAEAAAMARGAARVFADFSAFVAESRAVMAVSAKKLLVLANEHTDVYPVYNQWAKLRFTLEPLEDGPNWHKLRGRAEIALFEGIREPNVHYAALSGDGLSAPGYGECHITLKESMVAQRSTTFESNSGTWFENRGSEIAPGHRAVWTDRHKHACAKLGDQLNSETSAAEFPRILLKPGATALDHEFIEVHVYGPMTVRTFDSAKVARVLDAEGAATRERQQQGQTFLAAVVEWFEQVGIPVEFA